MNHRPAHARRCSAGICTIAMHHRWSSASDGRRPPELCLAGRRRPLPHKVRDDRSMPGSHVGSDPAPSYAPIGAGENVVDSHGRAFGPVRVSASEARDRKVCVTPHLSPRTAIPWELNFGQERIVSCRASVNPEVSATRAGGAACTLRVRSHFMIGRSGS